MDYKSKRDLERKKRSRSRSPITPRESDDNHRRRYRSPPSSSSDDNEVQPKPSTTSVISKVSTNLKPIQSSHKKIQGIQIKLNPPANKTAAPLLKPKLAVASAFNNDSDSEPEQLPPEAKMRMKNIGSQTPTSSGPNSFGKTKIGFVDSKKMFEKKLKQMMDTVAD